ncbi:N-formylglutamate amidohydrolase [Sphingorhabdus arenilitoris]|uniref:N-formylglutamate amidohydrolase n=1 Tax=Sphingorhabdus arenilitoris TaxID=1490041 RepID=A0ABV8RFI3_9SPHN
MNEVFQIAGKLEQKGVLIVADHASNHVPPEIDLGIAPALLETHIAWDIGVAAVAQLMVEQEGVAAILATNSRLIVDLNRDADEPAAIPLMSDGVEIPGNILGAEERANRLNRYHHPYHLAVAKLISEYEPKLLLSLHSFTPKLTSSPGEARPWEVGVLYNQDDRAARLALPLLAQADLFVGDQLPYSGKDLNATMNRHGEGTGTAYLGIEMRQDLVASHQGQKRFASILTEICHKITEKLGQ